MSVFKRGLFIFKSYVNPLLDRYEKAWRSDGKAGDDGDDPRSEAMRELDEEAERIRKGQKKAGRRPGGARRAAAAGQDETLARCWANLELPYGADLAQVKKAWRRLMKKYHPDRYVNDPSKKKVATELSQKITESYEKLERHFIEQKKRAQA